MDYGHFMPDGSRMPKYFENGQLADENRRLKERIHSHALEMQQLGKEIVQAMVEKARIDASIRASKSVAGKLADVLKTRLNQQNRLAQLLNEEREKQKLLHQRADSTKQRVADTKLKIADNRKRVDTLGDYAMKFRDNLQGVSIEITAIEEDMRRYRAKEGELVKLNVTLANAETELKEVMHRRMINTAIKQSELELNGLGMLKIKCQEEIEASFVKLRELDAQLDDQLNEKSNLQKQLDGLSIQTDIMRLDDLDVTLERHNSVISEVRQKHEEAMTALREQMKEAVQKNDAFQRVISELDGTLAAQHEELDRVKEEFEKLTKGAEGAELVHKIESTHCEQNQTEELIMHYEHQLAEEEEQQQQQEPEQKQDEENVAPKSPSAEMVAGSLKSASQPLKGPMRHSPRRHEGGDNLMASLRTSTPGPSMTHDSNSSFVSNLSTIVDDPPVQSHDTSFRSQISLPPKLHRPRPRRGRLAKEGPPGVDVSADTAGGVERSVAE